MCALPFKVSSSSVVPVAFELLKLKVVSELRERKLKVVSGCRGEYSASAGSVF